MSSAFPNHAICATLSLQAELLLAFLVPLILVTAGAVIAAAVGRANRPAPPKTPTPADLAALAAATTQIAPETMALISAAIWASFGKSARIAEIRELGELVQIGELSNEWSREGRREIYASHHIR